MSLIPDFRKILPTSSRRPHTTTFTDSTRRGSERCPYCGGYHNTTAEINACADRYNPSNGGLYFCPRCHQPHSTMSAANECCDEQKRFDRKYDPPTYAGYTGGYVSEEPENDDSWYRRLTGSGQSSSNGEGMFSGLFNFGGSNNSSNTEQQSSGGGIFDSFFNAGGKK